MKTVIAHGWVLLCRNSHSLLNELILIAVIDIDQPQNVDCGSGLAADVRYGSSADSASRPPHVRFIPKSGHRQTPSSCPLCAKSGHCELE
jgi:hypothetical protein